MCCVYLLCLFSFSFPLPSFSFSPNLSLALSTIFYVSSLTVSFHFFLLKMQFCPLKSPAGTNLHSDVCATLVDSHCIFSYRKWSFLAQNKVTSSHLIGRGNGNYLVQKKLTPFSFLSFLLTIKLFLYQQIIYVAVEWDVQEIKPHTLQVCFPPS